MKLSAKGATFIKGYEQCRLTAYQDSHVPPIWTIGWGHTGPEVHEGLIWLQAYADQVFEQKDSLYAQHTVDTLVAVPLSQNQYDALVSLVYNIGAHAFATSTLLRLLNAGDIGGASGQFMVWNHSGGVVSLGLTRRRMAEEQIFDATPIASTLPAPAPTAPVAIAPTFAQSVLNFLSSLFKKGS